jgi:hypothetical protein
VTLQLALFGEGRFAMLLFKLVAAVSQLRDETSRTEFYLLEFYLLEFYLLEFYLPLYFLHEVKLLAFLLYSGGSWCMKGDISLRRLRSKGANVKIPESNF